MAVFICKVVLYEASAVLSAFVMAVSVWALV